MQHTERESTEGISRRTTLALRIIFWALPLLLLLWLLDRYFVPFGTLSVQYQPGESSPYFSNVASKERYELLGKPSDEFEKESFQYLTIDPLYFTVTPPRKFSQADVTILYNNIDDQPVIKIGTLKENKPFLKNVAISEKYLETLPEYWKRSEEGNLTLWQKDTQQERIIEDYRAKEKVRLLSEKEELLAAVNEQEQSNILSHNDAVDERKHIERDYEDAVGNIRYPMESLPQASLRYATINDFLASPPDPNTVVQYDYDLGKHYRIAGYEPQPTPTILRSSLRGNHEIVTYVGKNEELSFTFTIQNINRHQGKDDVTIEVWGDNNKFFTEEILSYGSAQATGKPSEATEIHVSRSGLAEGVYHLKFFASDDVFIKKIVATQHLIMFYKNIYLTDNPEYEDILGQNTYDGTNLFLDGSYVKADTSHENGLQQISVGKNKLTLDKTKQEKIIDELTGITTIYSPKNDVLITTDGYLAFSQNQLFPPSPKIKTVTKETNFENIQFIIANYPQATQEGAWLKASASFDSSQLPFQSDNSIDFLVNFPGLTENNRNILLKEIHVDFYKEPLSMSGIIQRITKKIGSLFKPNSQ